MAPDRVLPGRTRWLGAAVLAALPLAHAWDYELGYLGGTTLINQYNPFTGGLDLVPYYFPGTPGELVYGFQAPARLFLAAAALLALMIAAGVRGRLLERAALAALLGGAVYALSEHEGDVLVTLLLALALVGRPVWEGLRRRLLHPAPAAG